MIYHMLSEPFSAENGLALAGIAANVMRFSEQSIAVCPESDATWGFPPSRVLVIPGIRTLNKVRGWRFVPSKLREKIMARVFEPLLSRLVEGDILWFYNWGDIAQPIQPLIYEKHAKLIYHIQNSHLEFASRGGFHSFTPDALIFLSEAMRLEVTNLIPPWQNVHTIYNGVDESRFYPLPFDLLKKNSPPVILFVGRLVPYKGVHILLRAMRILESRGVKAVCRVVGSFHAGDTAGKVTPYIQSLRDECPGNVEFVGFRKGTQIADEYRASDIVCCPSIWQEPFGLVNIEAMGCGIPVVASRVGGIPEIASQGGILLVEPDSPEQLAEALEQLITNRDLCLKLSMEGLASFRTRFDFTIVARKYLEVASGLTAITGPPTVRERDTVC